MSKDSTHPGPGKPVERTLCRAPFVSTESMQADAGICRETEPHSTHSLCRHPLLLLGSLIPHCLRRTWQAWCGTDGVTEPPLLTVTQKMGRMHRSEVDFGRQQLEKLGCNFSLIQINGNSATDFSGMKTLLYMSACNLRTCILHIL